VRSRSNPAVRGLRLRRVWSAAIALVLGAVLSVTAGGTAVADPGTSRVDTAPAPGIDAYVWAKPPGESDGAARGYSPDPGTPYDPMCDPDYGGVGDTFRPTGALRGAPPYGGWFPTAFRQLVQNAYPPLTG
jgi:cellulase/cellobiase CelA1